MKILNLTQHAATPEQLEQGVIDLPPEVRETLSSLLTFEEIPSLEEMSRRASEIAQIAQDFRVSSSVMIEGEPFFMNELENSLIENFNVLYPNKDGDGFITKRRGSRPPFPFPIVGIPTLYGR